jgi:hypothetical protein
MPYKITGIDAPVPGAMMVGQESQFATCLLDLFRQIRPRRIVETGTYLGMGTTTIIGRALVQLQLQGAQFFSIEVNPVHHAVARHNVAAMGFPAMLLQGLSVPRRLLPSREAIRQECVEVSTDGVFVDFPEELRVDKYMEEVDFPHCQDDLLGACIRYFNGQPDFLLLDSAGHMGYVEFNYVLPLLRKQCFLALDDTHHVKHFRSVQQMKTDSRFRILAESPEKFGFCFAEFNP